MLRNQFSANIRSTRVVAAVTLLVLAVIASRSAQAQTFTVLHAFTNLPDGGNPNPVIRDAQGTLYGTTIWGGAVCGGGYTCGTVFKVDSAGTETVLYRFAGFEDGANPVAALVQDAAGNLYGTTRGNGSVPAVSTIFKVDTKGQETVLHHLNGYSACCADSPLVLDAAGGLYGTSPYAGKSGCGPHGLGCGTVFRLNSKGKFTVLHTFAGTDGIRPEGGLVRDPKGNLFGSTYLGGQLKCFSLAGGYNQPPSGCGTVFKLDRTSKQTVLHTFTGHADGSTPLGVIQDRSGNLYGITQYGGDLACYAPYGCGTVFKVDTSGRFTVLFTFKRAITTTPFYASHLSRDSKGNLYGAKQFDGSNNAGFLFKLDPSGKFTNLFNFPAGGSRDGSDPVGLVVDSAGNFHGSLLESGQPDCGPPNSGEGCGTVFELKLTP
jgi:uncharacterized repeat protein (TIGR03803 family)